MRKNFGAKAISYPMPVLIIGTYGEDGKPNAMNALWGDISKESQISICVVMVTRPQKMLLRRRYLWLDTIKTAYNSGASDMKNTLIVLLLLNGIGIGTVGIIGYQKIKKISKIFYMSGEDAARNTLGNVNLGRVREATIEKYLYTDESKEEYAARLRAEYADLD